MCIRDRFCAVDQNCGSDRKPEKKALGSRRGSIFPKRSPRTLRLPGKTNDKLRNRMNAKETADGINEKKIIKMV